MSEFRPGDKTVLIAEHSTRLRLTIGALAEIADSLEADSPIALAAHLRKANLAEWNYVLRAMATPRPVADVPPEKLLSLMPIISGVMTAALVP